MRLSIDSFFRAAACPICVICVGTKFFNDSISVVAQLHEDDGDCYETSFTVVDEKKNDGKTFKAKK